MSTSPVTNDPYKIYRGIAAEDLKPDSIVLEIICPELMPHAPYGNLGAGIAKEVTILRNREGAEISSTATSSNHVVATWDGGSNKRYPPLIRKGEAVEIYRTEGQDKYRWRETGSGRDLRKTDRNYIEVAALGADAAIDTAKDDTNTYSAYLDSENKRAGMRTSKANGEVAAFTMEADLSQGTFVVSDDNEKVPNRIFLDTGAVSGNPVFQVNLSSGVTLKMEGEDLFLKVPGKAFVDVGDRLLLNSPLTILNKEKKGTVIINALSMGLHAGKDFVVQSGGVIGLNSVSTKIKGVLVAGSARIANVVKGAFGSDYNAPNIADPIQSPPSDGNNSADTSTAGPAYKAV